MKKEVTCVTFLSNNNIYIDNVGFESGRTENLSTPLFFF